MKILHVLNSRIYSGAENVVCTMIRNMPSNCQCIYLSPKGPIEDRLKKWGISYYGVECLDAKNMKKAFAELKPDVVHAHDFRASVFCAMAVHGDARLISHIHCNPPWLKGINKNTIVYRFAASRCSRIITVSEAFSREYRWGRTIQGKTVILGNPFSSCQVLMYGKSGQESRHYDIAFVGRLEPEKRPLLFLEIVQNLKKYHSDISAVMVGDGSQRTACEKFIEEACLEERISLVGFQENPYKFMTSSKLLIVPSEWEGFGLVALEAMALGKPVIASAVGGLRQIVADDCGVLCTSKEEFIQEAEHLLTDDEYYRKKSESAQKRAAKYDNIGQYIEKLVSLYGE